MTTHPQGIRIVLISGSVRPGNYTGKALALVTSDEIRQSILRSRQNRLTPPE